MSLLQDKGWPSAPPYTFAAPPRALLWKGAARRREEAGQDPSRHRARRSRWKFNFLR